MNEKIKTVLDKVLNSFESGDIPGALSIAVLPQLEVPCNKWSLSNRLICFFAGTSDARGFRQWKEVDRFPKKGSKAFHILVPMQRKIKEKESEEEKIILNGFRVSPVFRVEDTDGKELEIPDFAPKQLPPLYEVAENWGIKISYHSFQGQAFGSYSPSNKTIKLATHDESVFFHELAHHAHKLVKGSLKNGQDWKQEIVAQLSAEVLARLYGSKINTGESYIYIRNFAEKAGLDIHKACLSVIGDVGKVLELIIDSKTEKGQFT